MEEAICFLRDDTERICSGELIQHTDGNWYCSSHTIRCAKDGCERVFHESEIGTGITKGSGCDSCFVDFIWDYQDPWCIEHVPCCEECGETIDLCERCVLGVTNGKYSYLCDDCCDKFWHNPCCFARIKRVRLKTDI
uniref:Uncharacterized protein n=1 Tax=Marseillevirus LCMAC101 TaxID=2506602 RepID=A0A481YT02_9VIRU|nr:MAG: hypothetical protein LCMAC101_06260 [Marseillevirus LCMAC101]